MNNFKRKLSLLTAVALTVATFSSIAPATAVTAVPVINYTTETVGNVVYAEIIDYSLDGGISYTDVENPQDAITIEPGAAAKTFKYHKSATPATVSSLAIPARPAVPALVLDYSKESLLATGYEFSLDNEDFSTVATATYSVSSLIPASSDPDDIHLYVRKKATTTAFKSDVQTILLAKRAEAPATPSVRFAAERITGVTDAMQYRVSGTTVWTAVTSKDGLAYYIDVAKIINNSTGTNMSIDIRYAPVTSGSDSAVASELMTLDLVKRAPAPSITGSDFDFSTGKLAVGGTAREYSKDGGKTYTIIPTDYLDASKIVSSAAAVKILIRIRADSLKAASDVVEVTLPKTSAMPAAVLNKATEQITGLKVGTQEYSTDDGNTYSDVLSVTYTVVPTDVATAVYVRTKATVSIPASAPKILLIPARLEAPNLVVPAVGKPALQLVATSESLKNALTTWEYSINGSTWKPATALINLKDAIGVTDSVYFRTKSTTLNFHSESAVFQLMARPSAPSDDITVDFANETLSGLTVGTQEYSLTAGKTWITTTAASLSLAKIIPKATAAAGASVSIRTKASGSTVASAVYTVALPVRSFAPEPLISFAADKIFAVDSTMEYGLVIGTAKVPVVWTSVGDNTTIDNIGQLIDGQQAKQIWVRVKATETTPSSEIYVFTLAKRAVSPNVTAVQTSLPKVTNVIKGITTKMEYSYDLITWTTYNVSFVPDLSGDVTVHVRIKATAKLPASSIKVLQFTS